MPNIRSAKDARHVASATRLHGSHSNATHARCSEPSPSPATPNRTIRSSRVPLTPAGVPCARSTMRARGGFDLGQRLPVSLRLRLPFGNPLLGVLIAEVGDRIGWGKIQQVEFGHGRAEAERGEAPAHEELLLMLAAELGRAVKQSENRRGAAPCGKRIERLPEHPPSGE